MSYMAQYKVATNRDTAGRVAYAARKMALDVYYEDAKTEMHQARINLAQQVLDRPMDFAHLWVNKCLENPTVMASATEDGVLTCSDSDLEYVVASGWNDVVVKAKAV